MTFDGGKVGSTHLFITNLVAHQLNLCFTSTIHELPPMKADTFREHLKNELLTLEQQGIIISTVVCDGATYQTHALNFKNKDSIQAMNRDSQLLTRLLFIPCLCHRLNNAYHRLVRDSKVYRKFVYTLRQLAIFCRKPAQGKQLGRHCPQFIETRWLYDRRILTFILEHEEQINSFDGSPGGVTPIFRAFSRLLKPLWELVTTLEASDVPLSQAYYRLSAAIGELRDIAAQEADKKVATVFKQAADFVAQYTLDPTHDLIQLAYVLTPAGRSEARR
jgi:hypothetical protein